MKTNNPKRAKHLKVSTPPTCYQDQMISCKLKSSKRLKAMQLIHIWAKMHAHKRMIIGVKILKIVPEVQARHSLIKIIFFLIPMKRMTN